MATVFGNIIEVTNGAATSSLVRFTLVDGPSIAGASIVKTGEHRVIADGNGDFSTVLAAGAYEVDIDGADTFRISVPLGADSHDVTSRITSGPSSPAQPGGLITVARLVELTESGGYEMTSATYDAAGEIASAVLKWPDGSAGAFTTDAVNPDGHGVDAYNVTHVDSGQRVTQAAVTRNANGDITSKPALTVADI